MKSDVFIITHDEEKAKAWLKFMPTAKSVICNNLDEEALTEILKQTLTKFFFVVRGEVPTDCGIDFEYEPDKESKEYVHVWGDSASVRMYNRRKVKKNKLQYTDVGVREGLCKFKFLELSETEKVMDGEWEIVDNINVGIKTQTNPYFFVNDKHVDLLPEFNLSYLPDLWSTDLRHRFLRLNPITKEAIDYGGIMLHPLHLNGDKVNTVDEPICVEKEYDIIKVKDINNPVELDKYESDNRFVWIVDNLLDLEDFDFSHYPSMYDFGITHIWKTDFGVPSIKLVPVGMHETGLKVMEEPVGKIPQYDSYATAEEGFEKCKKPYFWVVKDNAVFLDSFRKEFYAKANQDNNYWWKDIDWAMDMITCFQTISDESKPHSAEGIQFYPNDQSKKYLHYVDQVAGQVKIKAEVPDIVYLSYDEEYADERYELLKKRYPDALRVHGVEGIFNAHKQAAELATTKRFFLVDADAILLDDFDMHESLTNLKKYPDDTVFVWRSRNPINGLEYGHGGLKCFPRERMLEVADWNIDFTTSLSDNFVPVQEVSNITAYATTPKSTWRAAFREGVKLSSGIIRKQKNAESQLRLDTWCTVGADKKYGEYSILGAKLGREFGKKYSNHRRMLNKINDFNFLEETFYSELWKIMDTKLEEFKISGITLHNILKLSTEHGANVTDLCSKGQLLSKMWMINELKKLDLDNIHNVILCAGWYGLGATLLYDVLSNVELITSYDMDDSCHDLAKILNHREYKKGRFLAYTNDIHKVNYAYHKPDMVVNTSCEHIENFSDWYALIPDGTTIVLQSNDFVEIEDHINCVHSENELLESAPMSKVLFKGGFDLPDYTRYMLIGIK